MGEEAGDSATGAAVGEGLGGEGEGENKRVVANYCQVMFCDSVVPVFESQSGGPLHLVQGKIPGIKACVFDHRVPCIVSMFLFTVAQ